MPKLELLKTRQLKQPPIIFASLSFRAPQNRAAILWGGFGVSAKSRSYFVGWFRGHLENAHPPNGLKRCILSLALRHSFLSLGLTCVATRGFMALMHFQTWGLRGLVIHLHPVRGKLARHLLGCQAAA